jgi:nucleotide-binding universal stress UspA family protein
MSESSTVLVWAVDALAEQASAHVRVANVLKWWTKTGTASIHPVYVISSDRLRLGSALGAHTESEVQKSALLRLTNQLSKIKLPGMQSPEVVLARGYSLRSEAGTLVDRARALGADAILTGTYGRKGMARLLMGSFTETLVLHSSLPIVTVPPAAPQGPGPIVFGTDFSPESRRAAHLLVPLAQRTKSKITLVHFVSPQFSYLVEPLSGTPFYRQKSGESWKEAEAQLETLKSELAPKGVKVDTLLLKKGDSAAVALAVAAQRLRAKLVAVASIKGGIDAAVAGSTARQLIRAAKCPVWVLPREA